MKQQIFVGTKTCDLTQEECKSINGGAPDKKSSFFYDVCYIVSHSIGDAVKDGILTLDWWEDWSISVSS
jgi:hypothetical protein